MTIIDSNIDEVNKVTLAYTYHVHIYKLYSLNIKLFLFQYTDTEWKSNDICSNSFVIVYNFVCKYRFGIIWRYSSFIVIFYRIPFLHFSQAAPQQIVITFSSDCRRGFSVFDELIPK